MSTEQESPDPSWDPSVRGRAHSVMTHVYHEMKNILLRYYDNDGRYIEPTGVNDGGDNTGMMYAANNEVLRRLDAEVQSARERLLGIFAEIDEYKQEQIGPAYKPLPRNLNI